MARFLVEFADVISSGSEAEWKAVGGTLSVLRERRALLERGKSPDASKAREALRSVIIPVRRLSNRDPLPAEQIGVGVYYDSKEGRIVYDAWADPWIVLSAAVVQFVRETIVKEVRDHAQLGPGFRESNVARALLSAWLNNEPSLVFERGN